MEADVALRSTAAVFTYCRSRGLFAGISLEGSYLIERKETNRKCVQKKNKIPAISFYILVGILKSHLEMIFCVFLVCRFYSRDIRASAILNGDVEPPHECYDLYRILDVYATAYTADWSNKYMQPKVHNNGPHVIVIVS